MNQRYRDREPRDGRPERPVLPLRRLPLLGRHRRGSRLRRLPLLRRVGHDRHPVRVRRVPGELLRPRPGALAALQHVPRRGRRARQDHRRARGGAGDRGRARRAFPSASRRRGAVRQVRFGYGDGPEVLHGLDLDVPAGTTVALVGHTGAGKSTIAKLLARFYDPRSGRITIDGHDLCEVTQQSLQDAARHRPSGRVPVRRHDPREHRFRETAGNSRSRSKQPPAAVGADDFVSSCRTATRHRSASAATGSRSASANSSPSRRALLADPRILILDEATSSVDIATERRIEGALGRLLAGRTSFVIAHRLSTIRQADLIVVLEDGVGRGAGDARATPRARRPLPRALRRLGARSRLTYHPAVDGSGRDPGSRPARRSGGSQRRAGPGRVRDRDGR